MNRMTMRLVGWARNRMMMLPMALAVALFPWPALAQDGGDGGGVFDSWMVYVGAAGAMVWVIVSAVEKFLSVLAPITKTKGDDAALEWLQANTPTFQRLLDPNDRFTAPTPENPNGDGS